MVTWNHEFLNATTRQWFKDDWFNYLQNTSLIFLVEDELLLIKRVQGSSRRGGLGFGQASLPTYKVHLHPRGCEKQHKTPVKPSFKPVIVVHNLPGRVFEPGLHWSPRARMTSTSRWPLRSHMLSWMSPKAGEAKTWRPTNWPGPKPSMNSDNWPSEPSLADEVNQLKIGKSH